MAVFKGKKVPVPPGPGVFTRIAKEPGKRSMVYCTDQFGKTILIGYICPDQTDMMEPNDNYQTIYKEEWKQLFGRDDLKPLQLRFGMYAAVKSIVESSDLMRILTDSFGENKAEKLLDYAMFSILFQSDVSLQYEYKMSDQVLFHKKVLTDSSYSRFFEKEITTNEILDFKKKWAIHCKDQGIENVWLCIDGSNEDCKCKGVEIAEKGKAKSKKNVNIVSFTYAVTDQGFPVSFSLYRGGMVDAKALKSIIDFLKECGIKVKGVILDRGYCNYNVLRYLDANSIQYVIMIKGEPKGYKEVLNEYKKDIKNNATYFVRNTNLFAAQKEVQLFKDYKKNDTVTIFYDFRNAAERLDTYINKVNKEMNRLEEILEKGETPTVGDQFKDIIEIDMEKRTVSIQTGSFQQHIDDTGIYGVVHSKPMSPAEVHERYTSRNASEKQYTFIKTYLGYGTGAHVHFTIGTHAKYTVGFVSSIIRYQLEEAARKINMPATSFIRELNLIQMTRVNKSFIHSDTEKSAQINLLRQLNSSHDYLDSVVKQINQRFKGYTPAIKKKKPGPKPRKTEPAENVPNEENLPGSATVGRAKPGPKPGSKRGKFNADGSERKKPGPQIGSKKGDFNRDGSKRQKPGPKVGSHHVSQVAN